MRCPHPYLRIHHGLRSESEAKQEERQGQGEGGDALVKTCAAIRCRVCEGADPRACQEKEEEIDSIFLLFVLIQMSRPQ